MIFLCFVAFCAMAAMLVLYEYLKHDAFLLDEARSEPARRYDLEARLIQAQIEDCEARIRSFAEGDVLVRVTGDSLAPHLEKTMWDLFEQIQKEAGTVVLESTTPDAENSEQDFILEEILTKHDRLRPDQGGLL